MQINEKLDMKSGTGTLQFIRLADAIFSRDGDDADDGTTQEASGLKSFA